MYYVVLFLFFLGSMYASAQPQRTTPQQSLNAYVAFLNQAVDEVTSRFQEVQRYTEALSRYRPDGRALLSLSSSGPLETYYYQKTLDTNSGLTPTEAQQVKTGAESVWQTLEKLDQTAKALETYVRLKDYQHDGLKKSNELLKEIQMISNRFSKEYAAFYKEIETIYRQYQSYTQANSYLRMEKEMRQVLVDERKLLQAWPYYMTEGNSSNWPVDLVRQRVVANEIALENFGKGQSAIAYPASSMVSAFKDALRSLQAVKRQAVNEYTFAAQQSAKHGNEVYLSLINHYYLFL